MITIAMADDHAMLRQALANMIETFGDYKVVIQSENGKQLLDAINKAPVLPDIVLLDISMPEMNGVETAARLQQYYPDVKVLAVSMMDDENAIIKMIRNGAKGYLLKDAEPNELRQALYDVYYKGFHFTELVTSKLIHNMNRQGAEDFAAQPGAGLSVRETEFLRYSCTELTYKEIADKMHVSPRTVDGYRDSLFEKLGIKTRVGLAMYAIKKKLVEI